MKIRAWHRALVFSVALTGCGRRTTDATDAAADAPPAPLPPPAAEAAPEDSSHDAPPTESSEVSAAAVPAAERPPEVPPDAPLATQGIEKAVGELAAWARKKGGTLGAVVLDVRDGRRLADVNGRVPVNPASNQKILTAAAALHYLGPAYRFRTELRGTLKDGVVDGLVLSGNGDPSLGTGDLWRLARVAKERGVTSVGTVFVDQAFFDEQFVPPAFEQQPNEWAAFRAPVSAVSIEQNTVTLNVVPNAPGNPAAFWFEPPGVVEGGGSIETRARGSGDKVGWVLSAQGSSGPTRLRSEVSGGIGADLGRQRYRRRLEDPRLAPGYALQQVLRDLGIEARGEVRLGKGSGGETFSYLASEPLAQLLYPVGKDSDNFYAETVLKALGAAAADGEAAGKPATSAAGAQALVRWLERSKIDTTGLVIKNGSGLFDANRVPAAVLAEALAAAHREPAIASEMVAQLAIGGVDGTLRNRFKRFASTRSVRAKTGTLRDVVALSGYVLAPQGRAPIAFSLLVTGVPGEAGEARRRSDRVVEEIVAALWTAPKKEKP
jgi:D-alanyl-D-alanine carboxypeptidase/D-alanyl-D-alanine-endopeptidase (penicillin-binding protein 4)